jgi:hypothetical protein
MRTKGMLSPPRLSRLDRPACQKAAAMIPSANQPAFSTNHDSSLVRTAVILLTTMSLLSFDQRAKVQCIWKVLPFYHAIRRSERSSFDLAAETYWASGRFAFIGIVLNGGFRVQIVGNAKGKAFFANSCSLPEQQPISRGQFRDGASETNSSANFLRS